jgi:hypothetical protein
MQHSQEQKLWARRFATDVVKTMATIHLPNHQDSHFRYCSNPPEFMLPVLQQLNHEEGKRDKKSQSGGGAWFAVHVGYFCHQLRALADLGVDGFCFPPEPSEIPDVFRRQHNGNSWVVAVREPFGGPLIYWQRFESQVYLRVLECFQKLALYNPTPVDQMKFCDYCLEEGWTNPGARGSPSICAGPTCRMNYSQYFLQHFDQEPTTLLFYVKEDACANVLRKDEFVALKNFFYNFANWHATHTAKTRQFNTDAPFNNPTSFAFLVRTKSHANLMLHKPNLSALALSNLARHTKLKNDAVRLNGELQEGFRIEQNIAKLPIE